MKFNSENVSVETLSVNCNLHLDARNIYHLSERAHFFNCSVAEYIEMIIDTDRVEYANLRSSYEQVI